MNKKHCQFNYRSKRLSKIITMKNYLCRNAEAKDGAATKKGLLLLPSKSNASFVSN